MSHSLVHGKSSSGTWPKGCFTDDLGPVPKLPSAVMDAATATTAVSMPFTWDSCSCETGVVKPSWAHTEAG